MRCLKSSPMRLMSRSFPKHKDVQITQGRDNAWHIRDFGRGLKYEHFTQNEKSGKTKASDQGDREVRRWAEGRSSNPLIGVALTF